MRNYTKLSNIPESLAKPFAKSAKHAREANHASYAKPTNTTKSIKSKKPTKIATKSNKAFGLVYAAIFLAIVGLFLANARLSTSLSLDRITNSHIHFQSTLYLHSLEDIARLCVNKPDFTQGRFDFGGGYIGGFSLQQKGSMTKAYLYVEGKNLRTGQILRATKEIYLPQNLPQNEPNNQNPQPIKQANK